AQATGATLDAMRKRADAEWKAAAAAWRLPQYYTARRGDALGAIATRWNTTPEALQRLNKLPDHRIRVGQALLVRPGA
ncbi:MAG TPA: LysM peptidoglycan-binding domain-containing protein, partial [Gemmatimonadaceae bacterium]